jgi:Ssp1 endopeptidase immunity protein Rap1a
MKSPTLRAFLLGAAVTYAMGSDAMADAPLSAAQLREYCIAWTDEPGSAAAAACVAYVQGFLDGATSVDGRLRKDAQTGPESFLDRARRTRLASAYAQRPPYCVDVSVPLSRIIHELLAHYETRQFGEDRQASVLVASTLRRFHPC